MRRPFLDKLKKQLMKKDPVDSFQILSTGPSHSHDSTSGGLFQNPPPKQEGPCFLKSRWLCTWASIGNSKNALFEAEDKGAKGDTCCTRCCCYARCCSKTKFDPSSSDRLPNWSLEPDTSSVAEILPKLGLSIEGSASSTGSPCATPFPDAASISSIKNH